MEILTRWDFGFVHQVLSFSRTDERSLFSRILSFTPYALDRYIITERYAPAFFDQREAKLLRRKSRRMYYRILARAAIRLREPAYWRYHWAGLKVLNQTISWPYLALQISLELLWLGLNPGTAAVEAGRIWRSRARRKRASEE
jgi:hypothetical protein